MRRDRKIGSPLGHCTRVVPELFCPHPPYQQLEIQTYNMHATLLLSPDFISLSIIISFSRSLPIILSSTTKELVCRTVWKSGTIRRYPSFFGQTKTIIVMFHLSKPLYNLPCSNSQLTWNWNYARFNAVVLVIYLQNKTYIS